MCLDFHPNTFMLEKMEVNSDIEIRPVLNTPTDNEPLARANGSLLTT